MLKPVIALVHDLVDGKGRGIQASDFDKSQSLGLIGMRERVWGLQGDISVTGDDPPGTRIDIVFPLPARPAEAADDSASDTATPASSPHAPQR